LPSSKNLKEKSANLEEIQKKTLLHIIPILIMLMILKGLLPFI